MPNHERHPYANLIDLLETVEGFVPEGDGETPGQVRDRMLATKGTLPVKLQASLPGRPWSAIRVRAALELLAAPGSERPIIREIAGRGHAARVKFKRMEGC